MDSSNSGFNVQSIIEIKYINLLFYSTRSLCLFFRHMIGKIRFFCTYQYTFCHKISVSFVWRKSAKAAGRGATEITWVVKQKRFRPYCGGTFYKCLIETAERRITAPRLRSRNPLLRCCPWEKYNFSRQSPLTAPYIFQSGDPHALQGQGDLSAE